MTWDRPTDDAPEPDHEFDDKEWWAWYRESDDREPTDFVPLPETETIDPGDYL